MSEQFITPPQPENNLNNTPDESDWGAVADTFREASSDRGLAMDSPILRKAVGLPPEPESESADKQD